MGKIMLNGVDYSASMISGVASVKGNAETSYRNGNVNIKPSDIGMEIMSTTEPTSQEVGSFWLCKY